MKVICAIFDHKALAFGDPVFAITEGVVIREFAARCFDDKLPYKQYPHDFELFKIGTFDEVSGIIKPNTPQSLGSAASFLGKSNEDTGSPVPSEREF